MQAGCELIIIEAAVQVFRHRLYLRVCPIRICALRAMADTPAQLFQRCCQPVVARIKHMAVTACHAAVAGDTL